MEQKQLRIYNTEKTFFNKITNSLSKLLIPTKLGLNNIMISLKRTSMLKAFDNFILSENNEDITKKEQVTVKYEDTYALYLESIDKYIMDSVYKKVKKGIATKFESSALSNYYTIIRLKEEEYIEYKYQKQKYLLELDNEFVKGNIKDKLIETFKEFYNNKMESLYKGLLKHYSVQLADTLSSNKEKKAGIYDKIFTLLGEYISNILPYKIHKDKENKYQEIMEQYDVLTKYKEVGLTELEYIGKNMMLLGISRFLFAHSLPLIAAEQCYIKLIKDLRKIIVGAELCSARQEEAYKMLIDLIEDYNVKLLSTKVYWDNGAIRDEYKNFWDKYKEIDQLKDKNKEVYQKLKETLFIKYDLKMLDRSKNNHDNIKKFYKRKLVQFGVMRNIKDKCKTINIGAKKNAKLRDRI